MTRRALSAVGAAGLSAVLLLSACSGSTPDAGGSAGPLPSSPTTGGTPTGGTSTGGTATGGTATSTPASRGPATGSPPATSAAADGPSPDEPFPADLRPDEGGATGAGGLSVVAVRSARQDGFDRVVLELDGEGEPGWLARYVDEPSQDGSGARIDLDGDSFLQVVVRGVGYPDETGVPSYTGRTTASGTVRVRQVDVEGVFEGQALAYVSLAGPPRPFRAFGLSSPPRVVVDVRDR